ncbi:MAG TPA: hypothetical protein VG144_07410, partial [Gaiellaceae bacterium]|nr:hypothetical protein [Gaiellaceae bacterium]
TLAAGGARRAAGSRRDLMVYVLLGAYTLLLLAAGVVTALKGKWATLVVGLFSFAWLFGATRLARPD